MSLGSIINVGAGSRGTSYVAFTGKVDVNLGTGNGGYTAVGRVILQGRDLIGRDVDLIASIRCINSSTTGSLLLYDVTDGDLLLSDNTITSTVANDLDVTLSALPRTGERILELRAGLAPGPSYVDSDGFTVFFASLRIREL